MKIQGSEVKRYLKNVSVRYIYEKMLILTFEDSEEEILNHIVSYVSTGTKAFQVVENARTELRFDGLEIDVAKRLVRKQKQEIDLTFTEFEILHLLARNPGRVFSKEQIYNSVWKEPYFGDYNIVMSHIRNIRKKIEDNPSKPIYIQTVWGVGYKFNNKLSRYCRVFVISAFYMADNNGLRTLPEKEYKKAVKFHVEFYSFPTYNI